MEEDESQSLRSPTVQVFIPLTNVNGTVTPFTAGGGTNFGSAINEVHPSLAHDLVAKELVLPCFYHTVMETASDDNVRSIPDFGFTMHTIGVTSGKSSAS